MHHSATAADIDIKITYLWYPLLWLHDYPHDMETLSALLALCQGTQQWPVDFTENVKVKQNVEATSQ